MHNPGELTKKKLIKDLQDFFIKYQKMPVANLKYNELCRASYYAKVFGSWNNAIKEAGLKTWPKYPHVECQCAQCNKKFTKIWHYSKKPGLKFCCKSCASIYMRAHTKYGCRRSKLEKYVEQHLSIEFPNLKFIFNDISAIGAELDIYIPELRLAFELNGIFHYEPIYSETNFIKMQSRDKQKCITSIDRGIELCVIDITGLKTFKDSNAKPYYDIIANIIRKNLGRLSCSSIDSVSFIT